MSSFSRGFLGLAQHGFLASSSLRTCHYSGSAAASLLRPQSLLRPLSPPQYFFSSSARALGKGPKPKRKSKNSRVAPPKPAPAPAAPTPASARVASPTARAAASASATLAAARRAPASPAAAAPAAAPAAAHATAAPAPAAPAPTPAVASAAALASSIAASPPPSSSLPVRSYADQLSRRGSPIVLYEAPSHFWFRATGLFSGIFCMAYTVYHYWTVYLHPSPDLLWWVPHAFGFICLVMAAVGTYFISGGTRIVRVIRAIPAAKLQSVAGPGPAARLLGKNAKGVNAKDAASSASSASSTAFGDSSSSREAPLPVVLEIEISRTVPLIPGRKLYVQPVSVTIPARIAVFGLQGSKEDAAAAKYLKPRNLSALPPAERIKARRLEEERLKREREYEMDHLMTAPFRHMGQALGVVGRGIKRAFSRDGFMRIEVEGKVFKLDVTGGWALENGRALDRLVTVKDSKYKLE